jgi:PAS domain S-box-containing protein
MSYKKTTGNQKSDKPLKDAELHRRAEARLGESKPGEASRPGTKEDIQRLLHELQVHQIELEMQNEELQQARREVQTGLEQYTDLYDFAPVGYFTLTHDGTIRQVNLTGARLLGVERARLVNRRFGLFVSNESRPAFNAFLNQVFENRASETCEATLLKDGHEPLYLDITARVTENGQECRAVAVDITARKRAEQALRESEENYRLIAETAEDWIYWLTPDRNLRYISPSCERVTGYSPAEFTGNPNLLREIVHPDDREKVEKKDSAKTQEEAGLHELEYRIVTKTGETRWISHACKPIYDQEGQFAGRRGTNRIITERKRAEEALRVSEERYSLINNSSRDSIYSYDTLGRFTSVNKNLLTVLKIEAYQIIGHTHAELGFPETQCKEWDNLHRQVYETNDTIISETSAPEPDGSIHYYEVMLNPLHDSNGNIVGIGGTTRDITQRKQAEETINSLARFPSENPNPVLRIARDGNLLYANEAAFLLLADWELEVGKSAPEVLKGPACEVFDTKTTKMVEIPCRERTFSIAIAPAPEDEYVNLYGRDITEGRRAEEALRESENTARAWLNAIQESAFLMDRKGIILAANATVAQRMHRSIEELVGACIYDFIPPETAHARRLLVAQVIESGQPVRFEDERSGRIIDNLIYPVFNQSGQVKHMAILGSDITERKQAEEALRESEDKFKYVFDNSVVGKSITLPSGEINMNKAFCEMLGYSPEELQIIRWQDITHPDEIEETQRELDTLLSDEKEAARFTKRYLQKNGSVVWADVSTSLRRDKQGKPLYFMTTVVDITEQKQAEEEIRKLNAELEQRVILRTAQLQTANKQLESELAERKRAEEALRESEERFRRLSEAAFEAINIHDGGILLSANDQYYEMFGYEPKELLGKQVIPLTVATDAIEAMKKVIATGSVGPYESTGLRKDGTKFPMEIRVREMEYKKGKVRVAAIMNITERKRAEEALQQYTAQLEAANKELEAFSYSISHDLRAPLRAMNGFSRILLEEHASQLPVEAQRYLGLVRDNAQQMGRLIEDLLAFSRLSRQPINKEPVAMADVVRQALAELRAEQEGRQVEISIGDPSAGSGQALPACEADPALLKQVWVNLLSNALKFTRKRETARIEIGCEPAKVPNPSQGCGEYIYSIKDNGVGFDMQYVHKLFGVFQRLHRAEEYEGTGVGLAIVQRIVHRHGGRIWAEAEVDKGATFYFTLGGGSQ